jgi:hypothetical protein
LQLSTTSEIGKSTCAAATPAAELHIAAAAWSLAAIKISGYTSARWGGGGLYRWMIASHLKVS